MLDRLTSKRSLLTFGIIGFIYFLTHLGYSSPDYLDMRPSPPSPPKPTNPVIPEDDKDFRTQLSRVRPTDKHPHSRTLGIADAIYVISLARRTDRRDIMNSIADALDLDFTYVDATDFKETKGKAIIDNIRNRVRWQRNRIDDRDALPSDWPKADYSKSNIYVHNAFPFKWSADVEENKDDPLARPLGVYGADYWDMYPLNEEYERTHPLPPWTEAESKAHVMEASVMNNQNLERWLTEAGFACWHSHHKTLREIVRKKLKAAIILEDDIDFEWNVENLLRKQWPALPDDWDIVYLGHCWSEEWKGEMLPDAPMLRKTYHTLCNHAYAISLTGATKILRYFRSPDYAFSRPIDHGYKDLIQMHMLKSFSVYPAVAVQTKAGISDIVGGIETVWKAKEGLVDSTLERIELFRNQTRVTHDQ